jgi:alanine racemase
MTDPDATCYPAYLRIDLSAIAHNLRQIGSCLSGRTRTLAVVKSDAYGHGAVPVAKTLAAAGADMLGVVLVSEGAELRREGVTAPILVLGGITPQQAQDVVEHDLTQVVFSAEVADALSRRAKASGRQVGVHVKVDTGMGRLGLKPEELIPFLNALLKMDNIKVQGLLTHLAYADGSDAEYMARQAKLFNSLRSGAREMGLHDLIGHCANSACVPNFPDLHMDMVRAGIMLYGVPPARGVEAHLYLKPAMSWVSRIIHIQEWEKGKSISYNRTFRTNRTSRIATISIGYSRGYCSFLSNRGKLLVGGRVVPIVGKVCMDMSMADVTDAGEVEIGEEVLAMGRQGDQEITAQDIAEAFGGSPYEVLCMAGKCNPRVYIN